jgi:hypothetical protein
MKTNKITFKANRTWLSNESNSAPKPIIKLMPDWFRKADRYAKDQNNNFIIGPDKGKIPTWKACPALFDIMSTGYSLNTPCDIEFFKDFNGKIDAKVSNLKYLSFIQKRVPMPQFVHPEGYYQEHFAWFGEWQVRLPKGYSAIYSTPFNRYDLPFLSTSGIIDADKVYQPGSYPFFVKDGFTGIVPAGTPFIQIIPFKRENWISEIIEENDQNKIQKEYQENSFIYRVPDGGVYKKNIWEQRSYE